MPNAKAGIVVFPGSNCDYDVFYVLKKLLNIDTKFLWHNDSGISDRNIIVLPGGFSYGDYLRCGAIARFSGIMNEVIRFAEKGGIVIGICNGFQILCECGLLPGALMRNDKLKFICKSVSLKVENNKSIFTSEYSIKENIELPVAHGEGKYYCSEEILAELLGKNRILFTYNDNPNGSVYNIAGIQNDKRNVIGMMPHPERAADEMLGNTDGLKLFQGVAASIV